MGGHMETPLRISFQGGDTSEALSQPISEHVDTLEQSTAG